MDLMEKKKQLLSRYRSGKMSVLQENKVLKHRAENEMVPLTFQQNRMWFINKLIPGCIAYNIPMAIKIVGSLDIEAFEKAINVLVERYDILRTVFKDYDTYTVQVVVPELHVSVGYEALDGMSEADRREYIKEKMHQESLRPFDLENGPLIRVNIWRQNDNENMALISVHHIIADTWTISMYLTELCRIYDMIVNNKPVALEAPEFQYADFACWQNKYFTGEVLRKQMEFWSEQLKDAPTVIELPTDHQRMAIENFKGGLEKFAIPADLMKKINDLTAGYDVTLYMFLMSVFQLMMYRYTNQKDILVGTPIANRTKREFEKIAGFFSNTVVIRGKISEEMRFTDFMYALKENILNAFENQEMPFEKIVDELKLERDMSVNPLFQVMFVLQNTPFPEVKAGDITLEPLDFHNGTCKFDLWLSIIDCNSVMECVMEYNSTIFERSTILRMIKNYLKLLEEIVADPEKKVTDYDIINDSEKQLIMHDWNNTRHDFGRSPYLHRLIEEAAQKYGDKTAVRFEGETLTYAELNKRANQLARYIRSRVSGTENLIGVCLERSLEMVIALTAIIKSGNAYVSLDPTLPEDRLLYMIDDSDFAFMVTVDKHRSMLGIDDSRCISLDSGWSSVETMPGNDIEDVVLTPESPAYMIYTSGSTGKPKGSINTHKAITNRILWMKEYLGVTSEDRILQKTPYSFDVSVWEFFLPLITGAELIEAKPEGHKDNIYLMDIIEREKVTIMHFVPSMLRVFLESLDRNKCRSLEKVICSGEALPFELQQRFYRLFDKAELHNFYGPTEAAVDVTYWHCPRDCSNELVPIGKPISNCKLYILDNNMHPVPIGVHGELYIGGICLSKGYHNREELTKEKFVPDIFGDQGDLLYRTGDIVKYLPDGNIAFIGRCDNQVKIKGFRIELGEIEKCISAHEDVQDAVVVVKDIRINQSHLEGSASIGQRLVAYIKPRTEEISQSNEALDESQVDQWKNVFDMAYEKEQSDNPLYNFISWNSSYTNEPFPLENMIEWADETVTTIKSVKHDRILEIGCGTGLLFFRLADHCSEYVGTDISQNSLDYIRRCAEGRKDGICDFELHKCSADDISAFENKKFDVIVINSVVQYFPSVHYLYDVLSKLAGLLSENGHIFIGDVRNNELLSDFHHSVELFKMHSSTPVIVYKERVQRIIEKEEELNVSPAFFRYAADSIEGLKNAAVMLKRGSYLNEMSKFRYDVLLSNAEPAEKPVVKDISSFSLPLEMIREELDKCEDNALLIKGISNSRIDDDVLISELAEGMDDNVPISVLKQEISIRSKKAIDPNTLIRLAKEKDMKCICLISENDRKCYDALFMSNEHDLDEVITSAATSVKDIRTCANAPEESNRVRQLVPQVTKLLKSQLPEYMIPSFFVIVSDFPVNSNGKLDQSKLPDPSTIKLLDDESYVAPSTPIEKKIAQVWAEILGIEKVGIRNNFFEMGGDSILCIRSVSRINNAGIKITPSDVFQNPTIEELAKIAAVSDGNEDEDIIAEPWSMVTPEEKEKINAHFDDDIEDAYPLSPFQMYMYKKVTNEPEYGEFVMQKVMTHSEALDIDGFEKAFQYVASKTPIMRTSFWCPEPGKVLQVVHKTTSLPFRYIDLTEVRPEDQHTHVKEYLLEDERRGLETDRPCPFRLCVVEYIKGNYMLIMTNSYLCIDGWSLRTIMEEVFMVYNSVSSGVEMISYPEHRSYRDFIRWVNSQDMEAAEKFWKGYMSGYKKFEIIKEYKHGRIYDEEGYLRYSTFIDGMLKNAIEMFAKKNGLTPNIVFQAAYSLLLALYSGKKEICYGNLVSGRPAQLKGVESIVGTNLNIIPLRVNIPDDVKLVSWCKEIMSNQSSTRKFENIPISDIAQWSGYDRDERIFDCYIIYQNVVTLSEAEKQVSRESTFSDECCLRLGYPLRFDIFPTSDQVALMTTYKQKFLNKDDVRKMHSDLQTILEYLINVPNEFLKSIYSDLKNELDIK